MPSNKPKQSIGKLWGGRFTRDADTLAESFTASVSFDKRLWEHDIRGSIAHAAMLAHIKVLSAQDCEAITRGLGERR